MEKSNPNITPDSPRVCILTAGSGTRMGLSFPLNKALLPLGGKAVLSRILEKFPVNTHFVIGLGFCGRQVRDFMAAGHPELSCEFVEIEKREGPGSGPARSLLECSPHLRGPFFFVACDTLWHGPVPPSEANRSWIGVGEVAAEERVHYCNVAFNQGLVTDFFDKCDPGEEATKAFTGLAFIHDPEAFFAPLRVLPEDAQGMEVSRALRALIRAGLETRDLAWLDVGTKERYRKAASQMEEFDFSKSDEFLFFSGNHVIKFFREPATVQKRVARARINPAVFPEIEFSGEQLFAYRFARGQTLYECFSTERLERLLPWLEERLWLRGEGGDRSIRQLCEIFYRDKTKARMRQWEEQRAEYREPGVVNGRPLPPLRELLDELPWDSLFEGIPRFIHGDLQPDNILCTLDGFLLLDWRQDFANDLKVGDLYYDLAKLRGGLLVNYREIKRGNWKLSESIGRVEFTLPAFSAQKEALELFARFAERGGYEIRRIALLNGLIFANMAPLHAPPFDRLLWNLARETLTEVLHGPAR
jgi:NDP-sugar pyrophosphorylase family protein